jgi:hypothetical protein
MRGHGRGNLERRRAPALAAVAAVLAGAALVPLAVADAQDQVACPPEGTEQASAECPPPTEPGPPTDPAPPPEPAPEPAPAPPPQPSPPPQPQARPVAPEPAPPLPEKPQPRCPKGYVEVPDQNAGAGAERRRTRCRRRCPRGTRRDRASGRCKRRADRRERRARSERGRRSRTRTVHLRRKALERDLVPIHRLASRPLPDPLPAGKRLDAGFADLLERIAKEERASWALVLAVLRERGHTGAAPAGAGELRALARQLRDRSPAGERVAALAAYHRAVGLEGLVRGLHAVKRELGQRVLRSRRISIYPGGRGDVEAGRIDVRVLVLMLYLADRRDGITVTSLIAGHSLLTKSGNVSLHAFGAAVDISAFGGVPVVGHQQPGGVTERALRDVMLLPAELRPTELISLFDLGGPSFAMADHADHVHVGY